MTLDCIAIPAMDLKKMKDFYVKYFGAAVDERAYILSFGNSFKIKLIPEEQDIPAQDDDAKAHDSLHLTFRLGSRILVNELTCQLILEGHEVICEPGMSGMAQYGSSVFDPEGNVIELVA